MKNFVVSSTKWSVFKYYPLLGNFWIWVRRIGFWAQADGPRTLKFKMLASSFAIWWRRKLPVELAVAWWGCNIFLLDLLLHRFHLISHHRWRSVCLSGLLLRRALLRRNGLWLHIVAKKTAARRVNAHLKGYAINSAKTFVSLRNV